MQTRIKKGDVEKIKNLLRSYKKEHVDYNEPHFTLKLDRQKIDRKEVVKNVLKPDKLVFVGLSESKKPGYDYVYDLYFKVGKNRTFKIPVSFKPKDLYFITIILMRGDIENETNKYNKESEYK